MVTHGGHLFDDDYEDGMRAATHVVHLGRSSGPAQCAFLHETVDLVGRADGPLAKALDEDSFLLVLPYLEGGPVYLKEVGYDLVVNLEVRSSDHECGVLRALHLNEAEDLFH